MRIQAHQPVSFVDRYHRGQVRISKGSLMQASNKIWVAMSATLSSAPRALRVLSLAWPRRNRFGLSSVLCPLLAVLVISASATLHASIINSGDLLTVTSGGSLRSYTFAGVPQQVLPITGLPGTGVP